MDNSQILPAATSTWRKLNAIFHKAKANGLRYPKIHLHVPECDCEIILAQAGAKSTYPDSISITSPGGFGDNKFYGRLHTDATHFSWSRHELANKQRQYAFEHVIDTFANNPAKGAKLYAAKTGHCSFCGTPIKTDESMSVGYGPICADKYGLPWGEKTGANEVQIDLNFPNVNLMENTLEKIFYIVSDWKADKTLETGTITDIDAFNEIKQLVNKL